MTNIVEAVTLPSVETRESILRGPISPDAFKSAFADLACLGQIEQRTPAVLLETPLESVRIVFWNAERLKYLEPSVALMQRSHADAFLLCELDNGMARSGNRHTIAEAAAALDAGYVYGVEFVELDLGDDRERLWHAGEENAAGLHGAALVSPRPLEHAELVRLETSGRWFDGALDERRVGGRIAIVAELAMRDGRVLLVSVHYESHTGPADRLSQTRVLLDAIDRHAPGMAVLIGGDFNTNTFDRSDKDRPRLVKDALSRDPHRLVLPMDYEPMFEEFHRRGYDWESCNILGAITQRTRPDGTPPPPLGRIDWFFARGLECSEAAVIPAVDDEGTAISDHDALGVTIRIGSV